MIRYTSGWDADVDSMGRVRTLSLDDGWEDEPRAGWWRRRGGRPDDCHTCSQGLDSQGHGGGAYLGADQPPRINGLLKARVEACVDGSLQQDGLIAAGFRSRSRWCWRWRSRWRGSFLLLLLLSLRLLLLFLRIFIGAVLWLGIKLGSLTCLSTRTLQSIPLTSWL